MTTGPENEKPGHEEPDFFQAIRMVRARRRKVNKARRVASEITYLNIVAMMDMMTIILVFLLKSVSFSTGHVSGTDTLTLPYSTTDIQPLEAVKVIVSKNEIVVEDKKVAMITNSAVDPEYISERNGYLIPGLKTALDAQAKRQISLQNLRPDLKFQGNLTLLADKETPYHIIMQVLYSAGQASTGEAGNAVGFTKFRLTVLRSAT